ncbi:hypothetical protein conserved [Leishmania donovani]|uniref:Uncharacterized protein n=3 Tax=Leishmania donovani species complex TaxID=38574 RepID=A4HW77_LEIIN|nr:conserved hypothetical protein [Leishmania infantum JPCM5]CAC9470134.1 hypothetical_protein_-_conserved [Leishmania infantum]CAJ1987406.1 hypothetical protein conserved [Leishmania donovani]CAM66699.1 conserved hypothetical protein [Leishmania infantum JPCM5]SUZ40371.1 hypothetical_protein_-_conserved [Leishmania infantum]VDZ43294.1 hypothetical_protein_conserved [Leishmania donovani]|eukprot:XP_001464318.1 conserved hypothetical protein [Leishmania infantum JPCM5]
MYNPALPNHYRDVVFAAYVRRRQREEAAAAQQQRQPNALASALSASSLAAPSMASVNAPLLGLSAEELHQHRIKESAALGIQRAVMMEKEALEVEHKQRRLEGRDARSRISSRLDKLKALAAKSKAATGVSASVDAGGAVLQPDDPSSPTSSPFDAEAAPSAPLMFQRSSLAAGGYVMTAADPSLPGMLLRTNTRSAVQGKPSSTLLLRFLHDSPVLGWNKAAIAEASTFSSAESSLCVPVLTQVQQLCRRFGFVRSMAARVYAEDVVTAALARARSQTSVETQVPSAEEVRREQLRVWVRFDSVTEAFKAAESLAKEVPPATPAGPPVFAVAFYPTGLYDSDALELREEDLLAPAA